MDCRGSSFKLFRRSDVWVANNEIGQGVHLALNNRDISSGKPCVDRRCPHSAGVTQISGQETLNASDTPVYEDQFQIEAVLLKYSSVLGYPVDYRTAGRVGNVGYIGLRQRLWARSERHG